MKNYKNIIKKYYYNIINKLYIKLLDQKPGEKSFNFILNLRFIYQSTFISGVLSLLGFLITTYFLDPAEYGKFLLLSASGAILSIPMVLGFPVATTVYMAKKNAKKNILSSSLFSVTILIIIFSSIYYLAFGLLSKILEISQNMFIYSLSISILLVYSNIFDSSLRGAYKIKFLSKVRVITSCVIILTLLTLYLSKQHNFLTPYIAMQSGFMTLIMLTIIKLRKIIFFAPSIKTIKELLKYALPASLPPIAGVVIWNVDKLFINNFMSTREVGIYGAYTSISTSFADRAINPFISVFLPTSVKETNKNNIKYKIDSILKKSSVFIFIFFIIFIYLVMKIINKEYHLNNKYLILFSIAAVITFMSEIYWWFVAAHGLKGIRYVSLYALLTMTLNILLNFVFIKYLGIAGAVISYSITHFYLYLMSKRFTERN